MRSVLFNVSSRRSNLAWCAALGLTCAGCGQVPVPAEQPMNPPPVVLPHDEACQAPMLDSQLVKLTIDASFMFKGTVTRLNATTDPTIAPAQNNFVVRFDSLEHGSFYSDLTGTEVTLMPTTPTDLEVGAQRYFFTNSAAFGNGIALHEVAHAALTDYPNLKADVEVIATALARRTQYEDLLQAKAILVGTVQTVGEGQVNCTMCIPKEYDPLWADAVVKVTDSIGPPPPAGELQTIRFSTSEDHTWYDGPKLKVGQSAVLVVHPDLLSETGLFARNVPGVFLGVVYHPAPFFDAPGLDQLGALKELLRCPPAQLRSTE